MGKTFLFVAFPAAFMAGFLTILLFTEDPPLTQVTPTCQIALSEPLQQAAGDAYGAGEWTIYTYDGSSKAPEVLVRERSADQLAAPGAAGGCELDIRAMPNPDSRGLDWRMGRVAIDTRPFRGRTVRARFLLKAEHEAHFASASVYIYDGAVVAGVPVATLNESWTPFDVTHAVPQDAKAFELWFRLLLDRPDVSPERNRIQLAVILEEVPGAAARPPTVGRLSGPDYSEVTCPLSLSKALSEVLGEGRPPERWVIYRHDGEDPAPTVRTDLVAEKRATQGPMEYCALRIDGAPEVPSKGVDWRIGRALPAKVLRGKTVRFVTRLRALASTRFDSATLYLYDGNSVQGIPVTSLDTDWQELTVDQKIGADATTVQAWLRLIYDTGTIVPGDSVIHFASSLDIVE